MRVGITLLPELAWPADRERWRRVEAYGFDHAWTFDHLAWRSLADSPWYATIPTLTAAALSTSTLRIGTWVTTPNFRHPVPLAKDLMTLDALSGGRLTVGLGAGAEGLDARMLGQPELSPGQRSRRFAEFATLLDLLLTRSETTWRGEWYTAEAARNVPGCVQSPRPPFVVAANGPKGMALARQHGGGWVTTTGAPANASAAQWWRAAADKAETFTAAAAEHGVRPGFARYLNMEARTSDLDSVERFLDEAGRAAALGFTDVVIAWPRPDGPFAGDKRLLAAIAERLPEVHALA